MVSSSGKIMASPQVFRHEDFSSLRIHQAGRRSAIKMTDYCNLTGLGKHHRPGQVWVGAVDWRHGVRAMGREDSLGRCRDWRCGADVGNEDSRAEIARSHTEDRV